MTEFGEWFCDHVNRVRRLVDENPQHALVEVNITDPDSGLRMEEAFGIAHQCWGHSGSNKAVSSNDTGKHFDLSQYDLKWLIEGREGIGTKWVDPITGKTAWDLPDFW